MYPPLPLSIFWPNASYISHVGGQFTRTVTVEVYHCANGDRPFDGQIGFRTHSVRRCKFDGNEMCKRTFTPFPYIHWLLGRLITACKRSCSKVMFSHACVFTGGGGIWSHVPLGRELVGMSKGVGMSEGYFRGGACVGGGYVHRGWYVQGWEGMSMVGEWDIEQRGRGGYPSLATDTSPHVRSASGRYASYWDAFLFKM